LCFQVVWPHRQTIFPNLKGRLGLVFCFPRDCHLAVSLRPCPRTGAGAAEEPATTAPAAERAASPAQNAQDEMAAEPSLIHIDFVEPLKSCMEPRVSSHKDVLAFVSHDQARWPSSTSLCRAFMPTSCAGMPQLLWGVHVDQSRCSSQQSELKPRVRCSPTVAGLSSMCLRGAGVRDGGAPRGHCAAHSVMARC
jgi:hypothetical protein